SLATRPAACLTSARHALERSHARLEAFFMNGPDPNQAGQWPRGHPPDHGAACSVPGPFTNNADLGTWLRLVCVARGGGVRGVLYRERGSPLLGVRGGVGRERCALLRGNANGGGKGGLAVGGVAQAHRELARERRPGAG